MKRLKVLVFALCLAPLMLLLYDLFFGRLSANPINDITQRTGIWTLRMLMLTLAVTPMRRLTGWSSLVRFRRMLGLFAFFYATLHFLIYLVIDQFFAWDEILKDIAKRPFITVGFATFVVLIPLAVTSTKKMIRRLGGKRWQRLHRLVYLAGIGGVIHYLWLVKTDTTPPLAYAAVLALLLGIRVWFSVKQRWGKPALSAPRTAPLAD
jgi:sulfoxide reductase heme-binding subunit YedZ